MMNEPPKGYHKTFSRHGESPKALQWINYGSAANRYRQVVVDIDIQGRSVLDVGCGMGDLLPYLYAKSDDFKYLGVDIMPEFIDIAKKRYEGHDFRLLNPFTQDMERFDVVVLCGALNANKDDWLNQRFKKIRRLFDLANEVLVFNMAGSFEHIPANTRVAYAQIPAVMEFCSSLTSKVILRAHYNPRDFTVAMFKQLTPNTPDDRG